MGVSKHGMLMSCLSLFILQSICTGCLQQIDSAVLSKHRQTVDLTVSPHCCSQSCNAIDSGASYSIQQAYAICYIQHTDIATLDCTPDSEVFPVTVMRSSLKCKGWDPNCVRPIEGVEREVIDLNSLHMGLLVEHFFDNNIEGNVIQPTLQAVSQ